MAARYALSRHFFILRHMSESVIAYFNQQLMAWFEKNHRPMPWKGEKNPYLIWLSEIILQQTRVEQGLPYFQHFKDKYPDVHALADAPEDMIMKSWEGLGYYSRARNLHTAARYVAYELEGKFPHTYEGILQLKGVGPYTAAAIASFAYDLPYAVLDGNVFRVLSRYFGDATPIDSTAGKKRFRQLAQQLLEENTAPPSVHNQAMMDFGATHCTPRNPSCSICPLQAHCQAFQSEQVDALPVKTKKIKKTNRYFQYLVIRQAGRVLLHKRTDKDIWQQLYQFPLIELKQAPRGEDALRAHLLWAQLFGEQAIEVTHIAGPFRQTLTHQYIHATFWEIELEESQKLNSESFLLADQKNLTKFAFPKIIDCYLQDNSLYLKLL